MAIATNRPSTSDKSNLMTFTLHERRPATAMSSASGSPSTLLSSDESSAREGISRASTPAEVRSVNNHFLLKPELVSKTSFQKLPHLSIPPAAQGRKPIPAGACASASASSASTEGSQSSELTTPETPLSLSSPIVGVVDLTKFVTTTSQGPVSHGGYSDIYQGELERVRRSSGDADATQSSAAGGDEVETVQVAIKLLRALSSMGYDEAKARKRLNREVYVWHRLEHHNIASFYGTSYHMGNRPSLILPWFSNGSASEYLKLKNPGADRLKLILDVAEGLEYLHTYRPAIVHGDLKGNNILINDSGRAILSDFGLSQVIEDLVGPTGITPSNTEAGPIRWQSPEFLLDETCRPTLAGDVWSFGCTAYELLTGNIPYHFRLRDSLVIQDIQAGVKPPGVEEATMHAGDGGIWDLMNDCWTTDPVARIGMVEVVRRLKTFCDDDKSALDQIP